MQQSVRVAQPDIHERVKALVDGWCDRREYGALRVILSSWPLASGLTDDWALLMDALRTLRTGSALPASEAREIEQLLIEVERIVYRS